MHRHKTTFAVIALCVVAAVAVAAKEFTMPKPAPASTYPAHDQHKNEKVAMAADPYDTESKASIFKGKYDEHGLLPVFFVVTNDSDQPVALTSMRVQLVTANRSKIDASDTADIFRRLSRVQRRGDEVRRNPLPIPLPGGGPKVGVKRDISDEVGAALFQARAVEAHATQAGFLFFDVSGIRQPLTGAHIYITGVKDNSDQELMYFDIPLDNYLSAGQPTR
jgi:hypothetical protein